MAKLVSMLVLIFLGQASIVAAQQAPSGAPGRIPTATRLVVTFHELERQLMAAAGKNDEAALDRLLGRDFEVWTPQPPGDPVPRAEWLRKVTRSRPEPFSIRQMSVRSLDEHAVASFVLLRGSGKQQSAEFVVDVWSRNGADWKLIERYAAPLPAQPYTRERKPTGKD